MPATGDGGDDASSGRPAPSSPGWLRATRPIGAPPPAGAPAAGPAIPARYSQGRELGAGGMGRVVDAVDHTLDRPVAIKFAIAPTGEDLARFEREVRITARLQHPGVVPIHDAGRDEHGQPFLVMRRIDGEPMARRVAAAATARERLALLPALLGAIDAAAYAHAQGIVHRDIKPWNILLGPFGEALLIDWGLARELDRPDDLAVGAPRGGDAGPQLTRVGAVHGTPGFMAPEQARGEPVDRRADVYSLGATLYYLLSGELPHGAARPTEVVDAAAAGVGPALDRIPPEVPAELVAIVGKATAAAPDDRYADAGELAADLRRFLAGQLVAAHRYSAPERLRRWVRRRRVTTVVAAAIVAIAVVVGLAFRRVVAERDTARGARQLAERRADDLLLDRARAALAADPTSAVALLRGLRADAPGWPIAREITRAAVAAGVERAIVPGGGRAIRALAFGPDGRLASADVDAIRLHDLARGATRDLAPIGAGRLAWLDGGHLAYLAVRTGAGESGVIDVATGARRVLPVREPRELVVTARGVAVLDGPVTGPAAVSLHAADGTSRTLATDAITIGGGAGLVAIRVDGAIELYDDADQRVARVPVDGPTSAIAVSPDGQRIAARGLGAVIERDRAGQVTARIAVEADRPSLHGYVGGELQVWRSDGAVVAADGPGVVERWRARGTPLALAAAGDATIYATREGAVAIGDTLGVTALDHRAVELAAAAIDPTGARVALGTTAGAVLALPLAAIRPRIVAMPAGTRLLAAGGGAALVAAPAGLDAAVAPGGLAVVRLDLATGARAVIAASATMPIGWIDDRAMAATVAGEGGGQDVAVWSRDGAELARVTDTSHVAVGPGLAGGTSAFVLARSGALVELPLAPIGPARTIATFPPPADGGPPPVAALAPVGDGLVVTRYTGDAGAEWRYQLFDRAGAHPLALPDGPLLWTIGRTSDGAWWAIADGEQLRRLGRDGSSVRAVDGVVRSAALRGDEVWAFSAGTLYVLDRGGRVIRTLAVPGDRGTVSEDGVILPTPDGVAIAVPSASLTRRYRLAGGATTALASRDGRTVVAATRTADGATAVVGWLDPVPEDPAALPAYLAAITNARLTIGSDAVTWDPR